MRWKKEVAGRIGAEKKALPRRHFLIDGHVGAAAFVLCVPRLVEARTRHTCGCTLLGENRLSCFRGDSAGEQRSSEAGQNPILVALGARPAMPAIAIAPVFVPPPGWKKSKKRAPPPKRARGHIAMSADVNRLVQPLPSRVLSHPHSRFLPVPLDVPRDRSYSQPVDVLGAIAAAFG